MSRVLPDVLSCSRKCTVVIDVASKSIGFWWFPHAYSHKCHYFTFFGDFSFFQKMRRCKFYLKSAKINNCWLCIQLRGGTCLNSIRPVLQSRSPLILTRYSETLKHSCYLFACATCASTFPELGVPANYVELAKSYLHVCLFWTVISRQFYCISGGGGLSIGAGIPITVN